MELTNEDVADILALLDSLPYDELDLQTSKFRLTLRRRADGAWTQETQATAEPQVIAERTADGDATAVGAARRSERSERAPGADPASSGGSPRNEGTLRAQPDGTASTGGNTVDLTTPMPGTFYRAPRPGAAPFVEVGSVVSEDTVVAVVETMKLMNPVHAGTRGRVAEICVANAEPVIQGTVLLRIDPGAG